MYLSIHYFLFQNIDWELNFNETHNLMDEDISRCREVLTNNLNDLLAKKGLHWICIADNKHDINVTSTSLKIRFTVKETSSDPNINILRDIVQICLDQIQLSSITVRREQEVLRWVKKMLNLFF